MLFTPPELNDFYENVSDSIEETKATNWCIIVIFFRIHGSGSELNVLAAVYV